MNLAMELSLRLFSYVVLFSMHSTSQVELLLFLGVLVLVGDIIHGNYVLGSSFGGRERRPGFVFSLNCYPLKEYEALSHFFTLKATAQIIHSPNLDKWTRYKCLIPTSILHSFQKYPTNF